MFKDTLWCKNLQHEERDCRWARSRTTESPQGGRSCLPSPRTSCRSFLEPCYSALDEVWYMTNLDMSLIQVNLCNTSTPCSSLPIAPPSKRSSSASRAWWSGKRSQVVKILSGSLTSRGPHPTLEASEAGNPSKVLLANILWSGHPVPFGGRRAAWQDPRAGRRLFVPPVLVHSYLHVYQLCLHICIGICITCVCTCVHLYLY